MIQEQSPLLSDDSNAAVADHTSIIAAGGRTRPYLAAVVILICCFLNYVCIFLPSAFYPNVARLKKGSTADTEVGFVIGSIELSGLVGCALVGMYMNRLGAKFLLVSGAFLVGGCTVIFGFVGSIDDWESFIGLSIVTRFIAGFGEAAFDTTSCALMLTMFSSHAATAWSLVELSVGLGFIAGAPIGGALFDVEGFWLPFMLTGGLVLMFIPLLLWFLSDIQSHTQHQESESQASLWRLIKILPILMVCLSVFVANISLGLLETSFSVYLDDTFGWTATHIGFVFLTSGGAYILSSPIVGLVVDAAKPRVVMILGLLIEGCGMMLIGPSSVFSSLSPKAWLVYVGMAFIGCGLSMSMIAAAPDIISCAVSRGYERGMSLNGLVSGLVLTFVFLSGICGAPSGGALTASYTFRTSSTVFAFAIFIQLCLTVVVTLTEVAHQVDTRVPQHM